MAGHSKWANIKHRKARQDAKRGKIYTKLIREITVAAKGGPDPADNPRLRLALDKATSENMPKDTINRAIQRGSGTGDSANLEEVTYEGYGPNGVAILVETMTDNRNRTVADVRHAFAKFGGNLGTDGSVAYLFNKIGYIFISSQANEDELFDFAIEEGADDIENTDDHFIISCSANIFSDLVGKVKSNGYEVINAELSMKAETTIPLDQETSEKVIKILDFMDDIDDVQEVHTNAEFSDELELGV